MTRNKRSFLVLPSLSSELSKFPSFRDSCSIAMTRPWHAVQLAFIPVCASSHLLLDSCFHAEDVLLQARTQHVKGSPACSLPVRSGNQQYSRQHNPAPQTQRTVEGWKERWKQRTRLLNCCSSVGHRGHDHSCSATLWASRRRQEGRVSHFSAGQSH